MYYFYYEFLPAVRRCFLAVIVMGQNDCAVGNVF